MVVADLHVHTTNSDGTLSLAAVPDAAREAGVTTVAITDHDRLHPELDDPVTTRDGVTLIHGIELRVATDDQRVDLLGYGVRPTAALRDELDRLQRDRVARGRAIVECVEDRLGVTLDVALEPGIGRPDIARAVVDSAADYDEVGAVFDGLIGNGDPCYVARDVPPFERGRRLLSEACAVVSLAHPLRYPDPERALSLARDLDAVEVHYPYDGQRGTERRAERDVERVAAVARSHGLLVTGGSDAHGRRLGTTGLDRAEYERFRDALSAGT